MTNIVDDIAKQDPATIVIPHSKESEQYFLACLLSNSANLLGLVNTMVVPSDLFFPEHRIIYEAILNLAKREQVPDLSLVEIELRNTKKLADIGGIEYLAALLCTPFIEGKCQEYAAIIRDKSQRRRIAVSAQKLVTLAKDPSVDDQTVVDETQKLLSDARIKQGGERDRFVSLSEICINHVEFIEKIYSDDADLDAVLGIPSGYGEIDWYLNGLRPGNTYVIAAGTRFGKTDFMSNLALNMANATKKKILYFALEMSEIEMLTRWIANKSRINNKKLAGRIYGELTQDEYIRYWDAINTLSSTNIGIYSNNNFRNAEELVSVCRREALSLPDGVGAIFVDYLQLLAQTTEGRETPYVVVSRASKTMKRLAVELQCPVIFGCQVNRNNETRQNKRPTLNDLRESGQIAEDANVVLGLFRPSFFKEDAPPPDPDTLEVIGLKNRQGDQGFIVSLKYSPQFSLITDC